MKTFRRYHGYDYSLGAFIFATIATEPRRHLFGHVTAQGFEPNPFGAAVAEALRHVAFTGKGVKLCAHTLMPDHLHARLYLARGLPAPLETLGQFVASFNGFWRAIGDISLLDGRLVGIRISQKVPPGEFPALVARYREAIQQGFTAVSTFVSPGERALLRAFAAEPGARAIRVVPKPLADPYRPGGDEPPLFAAGRFLLLAPCSAPEKMDRPWLLRMNAGLAAAAKASEGGLATYAVYEEGRVRLKNL